MIEATGRGVRVGRTPFDVEVELVLEEPTSGERCLCTRRRFTMMVEKSVEPGAVIPPSPGAADENTARSLRLINMILPGQTNNTGTFFGGDELRSMGKAAFIAAT